MGWNAQSRRQSKWIDVWTDLYSWGRVAHYLLQESVVFPFVEDIVRKATAKNCTDRFSRTSTLLFVWEERIQNLSQKLLCSDHLVQKKLPIPLSTPSSLREYPTWSTKNIKDSPERSLIEEMCVRSQRSKSPHLLIVHGPEGVGKSDYIYEELSQQKHFSRSSRWTMNDLMALCTVFESGCLHSKEQEKIRQKVITQFVAHRHCSSAQKEKRSHRANLMGSSQYTD